MLKFIIKTKKLKQRQTTQTKHELYKKHKQGK